MNNFELSFSGMLYCSSLEAEEWVKDPEEAEPNLLLREKPIRKPSPFAKNLSQLISLRPRGLGVWWVIYWQGPMEKPSYYWDNTKKEVEGKLGKIIGCARSIERAVAPFSGWIDNEQWEEDGVIHQSFIHPEFPFLKTEIQFKEGSMIKFTKL